MANELSLSRHAEFQERRSVNRAANSGSVHYRRNQQVEKHSTKPQVNDDKKIEQFALLRITANAECQVYKKGQRREQDNNEMHRLRIPGSYSRRRDRGHIDQATHRGTGSYDMRRNIATEQNGTDRHPVGPGFNQVHGNMRRIDIRHDQ